ncbi:nitroreductase [Desulfocucumis palustris]|uniref:Nitroreductase n=1 Tax=Desulfocucumis palustris TaxID=1898651 RepID=A0A2L2XCR1_9FIRM|nr:nitroreductase [Desulfocucumis palustris]GBF32006.1 nitroreductase [Desulfocucumis palustris]
MQEGLFEAIKGRYSVRAFLDRKVPEELIEQILETALKSPSWGNNQPWEIAVASGPVLEKIKMEYLKAMDEGKPHAPDIPFPDSWPEENKKRYFENGVRMYETMGIARDDQNARNEFARKGFGLFGAPHAVYLFLDNGLSPWALFDLGLFTQTLMLTAYGLGLGTCTMAMAAVYPDIIREALGAGQNKKLALGIAIGYPDTKARINQHRSTRIPFAEAVRFLR